MSTKPRFFVEFIFSYELTGRTYWLPLFIVTNDKNIAISIATDTKKALEERFVNVDYSSPVPELEPFKPWIKNKHDIHSRQQLVMLNADVWKFTDIEPNPDWSFDEHLKFIAEELPLEEKNIATRVEAHQFPVRVIKEAKFPIDFKEFLLINIVKKYNSDD